MLRQVCNDLEMLLRTVARNRRGNDNNNCSHKDREITSFKSLAEDTVGLPCHELSFMTRNEIKDRGDRVILEAYIKSK